MSERKSVFDVVVDIETKVLEKFDNGFPIDLIASLMQATQGGDLMPRTITYRKDKNSGFLKF